MFITFRGITKRSYNKTKTFLVTKDNLIYWVLSNVLKCILTITYPHCDMYHFSFASLGWCCPVTFLSCQKRALGLALSPLGLQSHLRGYVVCGSPFRWYGHVKRMSEERLAKRVYMSDVTDVIGTSVTL